MGNVTVGSRDYKAWDHTVSTAGDGIAVTGSGTGRVVNGSVTVQHNILKYTSTTTFDLAAYGEAGCCFPTSGSVGTTFSNGTNTGKTEKVSFSLVCGEATLTTASGATESLTLEHCL